jgi:hypothetical protein
MRKVHSITSSAHSYPSYLPERQLGRSRAAVNGYDDLEPLTLIVNLVHDCGKRGERAIDNTDTFAGLERIGTLPRVHGLTTFHSEGNSTATTFVTGRLDGIGAVYSSDFCGHQPPGWVHASCNIAMI